MLSPFAHPFACCWAKFETGQTFSHVQLPTMLGVVGQQFCIRLHGALVTVILIIFSRINFSLLIIYINFCPIYPGLYVGRKTFCFWVHDLVWFPIVYFYDLICLQRCFVSIKIE